MDISAFSSVVNNNQDLPLTDSAISQIENLINQFFNKGKNIILRFALGVIETNTEAISFWEKLGFKKTGKIYNHEKYNVIMMSNKL